MWISARQKLSKLMYCISWHMDSKLPSVKRQRRVIQKWRMPRWSWAIFGFLFVVFFKFLYTLYNAILRTARNFLETRENVKILTHPFYHINLSWFSCEWSKFFFFFSKKKFKMADSKKAHFSKSPILKIFSRKFLRFVLGLVGLNDAKGIDVAQGIWP